MSKQYCWDHNIRTPKVHFISHYPRMLQYYGQLASFDTSRFERIHAVIKQHYKHGKNFKNIAFSLAQLHQESIFIRKFWFPGKWEETLKKFLLNLFTDTEPPQDCIDLPKKWHPFPLGYGIMKGHYRRRFQIRIGNWIFNKTWGIVRKWFNLSSWNQFWRVSLGQGNSRWPTRNPHEWIISS